MKALSIMPKRRPQVWAQQILTALRRQQQRGEQIPFTLKEDGISVEMTDGDSRRTGQEVNLAIRWHNIDEARRWEETRARQIKQAQATKAGTVTIQDYEQDVIPWRVFAVKLDSGMYHIQVTYGQLKRPPRSTRLNQLANKLSLEHVEELPTEARVDPFEKWLNQGDKNETK